MALVERDDRDGVAYLSLNRPELLNALSIHSFVELRAHIDRLRDERESVGCVVVRGNGKSFCAGYDLKSRGTKIDGLPKDFMTETVHALAALPQVVMASIRGHCFTGGLELALAADLIIATETARFADTHGRWGMHAHWGLTQRLPRRIGVAAAKDLMFTGRELGGAEALGIGLINRCVPDIELDAATEAYARSVVANSWKTTSWVKDQIDHGMSLPLDEALRYEATHRPLIGAETDERLGKAGWR